MSCTHACASSTCVHVQYHMGASLYCRSCRMTCMSRATTNWPVSDIRNRPVRRQRHSASCASPLARASSAPDSPPSWRLHASRCERRGAQCPQHPPDCVGATAVNSGAACVGWMEPAAAVRAECRTSSEEATIEHHAARSQSLPLPLASLARCGSAAAVQFAFLRVSGAVDTTASGACPPVVCVARVPSAAALVCDQMSAAAFRAGFRARFRTRARALRADGAGDGRLSRESAVAGAVRADSRAVVRA